MCVMYMCVYVRCVRVCVQSGPATNFLHDVRGADAAVTKEINKL